jgi:DNA-binding NtrC family response regulator
LSSTTSDIKIRILVVDDEPDILLGLNALLAGRGHYVKTFDKPTQALADIITRVTPYDLAITDYRMPGGISGIDFAKQVKVHSRGKTKVIMMTAFDISSLPEFSEAIKLEIVDEIVQKPIPNDKLIAIIEKTFLHNNH